MKRKVLSLLLALTCTVSLAACGTKTNNTKVEDPKPAVEDDVKAEIKPEDGAKLTIWTAVGVETDFLTVVGDEFKKKYPGVEITYEEVGAVDAKGKMQTDGPAGVGADVFDAPHDHTGELVASGLILENALFGDRVKNDYVKAASDAVSYEGKVYGYPTAIETYGLFYNTDVFPEAPKTYEEIIAKAKTFNDVKANKFAFMWDVGNAYFSHSFIAGGGGYIFKDGTDKDDVGIDSAGAIEGAKSLMALKEILPINAADSSAQIFEGLFHEGKVGAMIDGPWEVDASNKSGVNYAVAPLPKLTNGDQQSSFSGIKTLFVSAYSKYPVAAQMFASLATSDEMLLKRYELTKQIPPVTKLMESDAIKSDPMVAPFLVQAGYAVPMPSIPQMGLVWDPYGAAFSSMWNDGVTPEVALKAAAKTVRDAIAAQK
jgi:arabinogalactan oligomer/maltooligosaccharide transport system substrate-binding protein